MIAAFFYWSGVVAWIGVIALVPLAIYVEIESRRPVPKWPRWGTDARRQWAGVPNTPTEHDEPAGPSASSAA